MLRGDPCPFQALSGIWMLQPRDIPSPHTCLQLLYLFSAWDPEQCPGECPQISQGCFSLSVVCVLWSFRPPLPTPLNLPQPKFWDSRLALHWNGLQCLINEALKGCHSLMFDRWHLFRETSVHGAPRGGLAEVGVLGPRRALAFC